MSRVHKRDALAIAEPNAHIPRIGIVSVNEIRHAGLLLQPFVERVGEVAEMSPELLLGDVGLWSCGEANDSAAISHHFDGLGIVRAHTFVDHQPCDQIHALHVWLKCEGLGQLHHIFGLPAGVSIATKLQLLATDQPVNADQHNEQGLAWAAFFPRAGQWLVGEGLHGSTDDDGADRRGVPNCRGGALLSQP